MSVTINIGRDFDSVEIPKEAGGVSRRHACIIVHNAGYWELVDTGSTNGTFIENESGELEQISRRVIQPSTVVVLGAKRIDGFRFVAGTVKGPDGKPLASPWPAMWRKLQADFASFKQKEARAHRNFRYGTHFRNISSLIAMVLCFGIDNALWVKLIMGFIPAIANIVVSTLTDRRQELMDERRRIMVCPRCGRPLMSANIEYGQCPVCKCSMVS